MEAIDRATVADLVVIGIGVVALVAWDLWRRRGRRGGFASEAVHYVTWAAIAIGLAWIASLEQMILVLLGYLLGRASARRDNTEPREKGYSPPPVDRVVPPKASPAPPPRMSARDRAWLKRITGKDPDSRAAARMGKRGRAQPEKPERVPDIGPVPPLESCPCSCGPVRSDEAKR